MLAGSRPSLASVREKRAAQEATVTSQMQDKTEPPPLPSDFPPSSEPPPAELAEGVQSDEELG